MRASLLLRRLAPAGLGLVSGAAMGLAYARWPSNDGASDVALQSAKAIVTAYADRTRALANEVDRFLQVRLRETTDCEQALGPLGKAVEAWNGAYAAVQTDRTPLLLQLLRHANSETQAIACSFGDIDTYQWTEARPLLNSLGLNLATFCQQSPRDAATMESIRAQQQIEWPRLCKLLLQGAARFSAGEGQEAIRCSPSG